MNVPTEMQTRAFCAGALGDLARQVVDVRDLLALAEEKPETQLGEVDVATVLQTLPGYGPARSQRVMSMLALPPTIRLGQLSSAQREALCLSVDGQESVPIA